MANFKRVVFLDDADYAIIKISDLRSAFDEAGKKAGEQAFTEKYIHNNGVCAGIHQVLFGMTKILVAVEDIEKLE